MTTADKIYKYLDSIAPLESQEGFDNAGFLFGSHDQQVSKVLLALDATSEVISEAAEINADLIITHHPLIWGSYKNIIVENTTGKKLLELAKIGISVISMHTNLDKYIVNDVLIRTLGAVDFQTVNGKEYLRIGYLKKPISMSEFLPICKAALNTKGIRYFDSGKKVYKIACIGGAGDDGLLDAFNEGCDTFITADIRYHAFLDAKEKEINLIDGDHFCTENPAVYFLKEMLSNEFNDIEFMVSKKHHQVIDYA